MKVYWGLEKYRELILYCIIGCTGAGLDFVIFVVLTKCFLIHYQQANFVSVSLGIINNFFWNCYFNFKTKDRVLSRFVSFYSIGLFGWALSVFFLWLLIKMMDMNSIVAKLSTILVVTVLQFCLNKFITFGKANSH